MELLVIHSLELASTAFLLFLNFANLDLLLTITKSILAAIFSGNSFLFYAFYAFADSKLYFQL